MPKKLIFVSCGVHAKEETTFGEKIGELIEAHDMTSFIAPKVHQAADLNTHVFKELQRCDGFVAVLQKRGEIHYEKFPVKHRASVWIHQEIGILFYRSFLLGQAIPMRLYMDAGVLHEGLTTYSIINPIEFEKEETVLEDLSQWLIGPTFEEEPVLNRRKSLFKKRIEKLEDHDWLLLELIAAHSSDPGGHAPLGQIASDFKEIRPDIYERENRSITNLLGRIASTGLVEGSTSAGWFQINKPWWDLVLEQLKNQGR